MHKGLKGGGGGQACNVGHVVNAMTEELIAQLLEGFHGP